MKLFGHFGKANYIEVEATVVSISEKRASGSRAGNSKVYQPTFTYEWKGFTRTVESPVWASFYNFNVGDKVTLLINPEDGSDFRFKNGALNPLNFIIRTMLFLVILIIIMRLTNRI